MGYFRGSQVVWIGINNENLTYNTIYTIDNFVDLPVRRVRLTNGDTIHGRLLIQVKLKNGQKSEYLPFSTFKSID
jgi:hypothetical protein